MTVRLFIFMAGKLLQARLRDCSRACCLSVDKLNFKAVQRFNRLQQSFVESAAEVDYLKKYLLLLR